MSRPSFRTVIIVSLVLIVGTISFSSFYLYNHYLNELVRKEAEANKEFEEKLITALDLLKNQYYFSVEGHDGRVIQTLLQRMGASDQIINSYLFNDAGELKYRLKGDSIPNLGNAMADFASSRDEIILNIYSEAEIPFFRSYFKMQNTPSCYGCHPREKDILGFVVIDFAMAETPKNTGFIHGSSFFFSLVMILLIGGMVMILHFRFIKRSLQDFKNTIHAINSGNLSKRLSIPETRELGKLGMNFNSMLDSFQQTQKELKDFHKKELRNNYKLATIGEMASRLAHEIRNPLTGISNAIEILARETTDTDNIPVYEEIRRQSQRVNMAINDLLKYARKKDLNLELNNINEVIEATVFFLESQVKDKEIEFLRDFQDDIPQIQFDQAQIEDVILNLGYNALHAIDLKGSITFITRYMEAEGEVHITVSDTGKGIPEEVLPQIFHPFFTTRNEGTGLGLAIVKEIIEKHRGEIWAENNSSEGCRFTVALRSEDETGTGSVKDEPVSIPERL